MTPARAVVALTKGAAAGVVGTLAMDLLWYRRHRRDGGEGTFAEWEFSGDLADFDDAPAPGKIGKRVADAAGIDLPDRLAGPTTDSVHWLTGIGWGALAGAAASRVPGPPVVAGIAVGVVAWVASYAVLTPIGLYDPPWDYDAETLWDDASAHLVYGAAVGAVLTALGR